ncbi:hypothetical protein ANO11243_060110 [Dothideomycetidae sp. 11243]|nr:hypothetical protein ANO11243_060110 [fungal sp. No.11243]
MRSSLLRLPRLCDRQFVRCRQFACTNTSVRWSSSTSDGVARREWSTPLAKILGEAITTTGPIPVATYMRQCLTSDLGGYYTHEAPEHDPFGRKGDFVTSPEISQVFGELVGLWVVAEWIAQGRKSEGISLMEMGPGRGTLMDDMLRVGTIRNFKDLVAAIDGIYLVEASPTLRGAQHKLLCGEHPLEKTDVGFESRSKYDDKLRIVWCEDVRLLPKDTEQSPFIVAHEFFDALPVHVFQSVAPNPHQGETIQTPTGPIEAKKLPRTALEHQWRELVVSPASPFALDTATGITTTSSASAADKPEFELTLSRASTPHSLYLPELSERYKALKSTTDAVIEISPESQTYAADFATRIGTSGAALIIDYGPRAQIPANSLRGIRKHARVSPFASAGLVDLSADVDFLALAEAALNSSPDVEVHGPVSQATFLGAMGIEARVAQLVKQAMERSRGASAGDESLSETVKRIESGWKRLVDRSPQGMGVLYQVMAIVPHWPDLKSKNGGPRRPVGFGGDVVVS